MSFSSIQNNCRDGILTVRKGEIYLAPTKMILFLLLSILCIPPTHAQEDDSKYRAVVFPESAIIRSLPSQDEGDFIASAYRSDVLEAVGINLDGTWFLVRRLGRMSNIGWMSRTVLDYDFMPETLPLLDAQTGAIGDFVLPDNIEATGFTLAEINLREQPNTGAPVITRIPFGIVLPVIQRQPNTNWFQVSYLGRVGWVDGNNLRGVEIIQIVVTDTGDPNVPQASTLVIPLSVQLDEIQQFRDYLSAQNTFANDLSSFWNEVYNFETMPCDAPPFVQDYLYTQNDERAFPELEYLVPRLDTATDFINAAIEPLYECGVKGTFLVIEAKNNATNAAIIYSSTLNAIANIEAQITANR